MKLENILTVCFAVILCVFLSACHTAPDTHQTNSTEEKHAEFTEKAEEIEKYSKENYETAETQLELNTESYNVYIKWDSLMNEVYEYLGESISPDAFSSLKAKQEEWILEREKAVEEAATAWKGGSGEPMARNSAGIKYTKERCYYLISLVKMD